MCGNLKLQNTPHPINPWFLLRLWLQTRMLFSNSIPLIIIRSNEMCESRNWFLITGFKMQPNGKWHRGRQADRQQQQQKKSTYTKRVAECGQTKGIRIRSRIYYAINDHALLKSCIFSFRSVYLCSFFMVKLSLILPVGRSVDVFFLLFHGFFSIWLMEWERAEKKPWIDTLQNHISDYKCGRKF